MNETMAIVHDFIGQPIEVGGWVAATGGGNTKCEYGSILYRVLEVSPGKLKLQRLKTEYPDHKVCTASVIMTIVYNTNKYIVVHPKPTTVAMFDAVVNGTATKAEHGRVGRWVHGMKPMGSWQ